MLCDIFFLLGDSQKEENKFPHELQNAQLRAVGKVACNGKRLQLKTNLLRRLREINDS